VGQYVEGAKGGCEYYRRWTRSEPDWLDHQPTSVRCHKRSALIQLAVPEPSHRSPEMEYADLDVTPRLTCRRRAPRPSRRGWYARSLFWAAPFSSPPRRS